VLEARPKRRDRRRSVHRSGRRKWLRNATFLLAAGLLVAGGITLYRAVPVKPVTQGQELIQAAQQMVRKSIGVDRKTAFCSEEQTSIEAFPDGKVRVSGWVDLITTDGKADRQNYSVVVFKDAADQWMSEKLTVLPQM
jgi:hypothetical protein